MNKKNVPFVQLSSLHKNLFVQKILTTVKYILAIEIATVGQFWR